MHRLYTTINLPLKREEVFPFFAEAANLERITPPELNFHIVTPQPIVMQEGTFIKYKMSLFGVRFHWLTRITRWMPPCEFVDEQVSGPYQKWVHLHKFTDLNGSTRMEDKINYRLPFFPFGELFYPIVHFQLKRIFAFRKQAIGNLLMRLADLD